MRVTALLALAAVLVGCNAAACPDDITVGTAIRDYRTNTAARNRDWSVDYFSVQLRWRLKPEHARGD